MLNAIHASRLAMIALLACILPGCGGDKHEDSPPAKTVLMSVDVINYRIVFDGNHFDQVARSVLDDFTKAGIRASINGCAVLFVQNFVSPLALFNVHEDDVGKAEGLRDVSVLRRDDLIYDPGPPKQVKSIYPRIDFRADYFPCEQGPPGPNNP